MRLLSSVANLLLDLALAPLRRVLGRGAPDSALAPGTRVHHGPGAAQARSRDVLLVLFHDDIPMALELAQRLPDARTLTVDPGLFDVLISSGLPAVEYLEVNEGPGFDSLYPDIREEALAFEERLRQGAGDLLDGVGSFSWAYLHLYHFLRTQRWYAWLGPVLARHVRGCRLHIPLNDNPVTFHWPSFVPGALLADALKQAGIETRLHPCNEREDETWALPALPDQCTSAVSVLAHLPTATHDAAYLQDALAASGERVLLLEAKYWQPALQGFDTLGLARADETLARLGGDTAKAAAEFHDLAAVRLEAWMAPLLPRADLRARQVARLASLYRTQFILLQALRRCFASQRPALLLLSSHDCDFHGPLVSWAEAAGMRVLMFPHSKAVPNLRFPAATVEVLCHPTQDRDIVDPRGMRIARIPLAYPRRPPAPRGDQLRKLGLLLNAVSLNGQLVCPPLHWFDGLRALAHWCDQHGIELHVRSRPGVPLRRLLQTECGFAPEEVGACTDMPLEDFAAQVDACVMYDAPTAAGLALLESGALLLHAAPRALASYEAVTAHSRLTPLLGIDDVLATLDALVAEPAAFARRRAAQQALFGQLMAPGHALPLVLQKKEAMRDPLKDLTIVVPSHQRHTHLARLLAYYADQPLTLIVLDDSEHAFDTAPFTGRACRLLYRHRRTPIIERLQEATQLVDTPFVMLSCDDEYYLHDGLRNCLTTLANDPALAAVNGRCAAFVPNDDGIQAGLYYDFLRGYDDRQPLASDRLASVAGLPQITSGFYYAMMRRDVFLGAASQAFRRPYASPYVQELLFATCLFIQGQVTTVDDLVWLRNLDTPPVSQGSWDRRKTLSDWFAEAGTQEEVRDMLSALGAFYAPYAAPDGERFSLKDYFDAILAFDRRANAGEIGPDIAHLFPAPVFLRLCRSHGIPLDEAALRRVEDLEIEERLRLSAALQARVHATRW